MPTAGDLDVDRTIRTLIQTVILVVIIVGIIGTGLFNFGPLVQTHQVDNPDIGSGFRLGPTVALSDDTSVTPSLGNALYFDGNDSLEAGAPDGLTAGDSAWTVCATGRLGQDVDRNGTYTLAAYENESIHLQYDHGDWFAYYSNGSADTSVSVEAPSPGTFTTVCERWNGTHLAISRGGTLVIGGGLNTGITPRNVSFEWNGTIDELRAFNDSLTHAEIQNHSADPVRPLAGTNRSVRFLFDEGEGSSTRAYFANIDVELGGAEWTTGVQPPTLDHGSDYEIDTQADEVTIVSGGYLEGAPVVWVQIPRQVSAIVVVVVGAFKVLLVVGILVLVASRVMELSP